MRLDWRLSNILITVTLTSLLVYNYFSSSDEPITESSSVLQRDVQLYEGAKEVIETQKRRLTDALLIGVSKCGSTALMFFLDINPQIRALVSEIEYMCDEENFAKGIDFYNSKLPTDVAPDEVIVERDGTCWRKNYAQRVYSTYKILQKELKIILVVCDPVYRTVSWFVHGKNNPSSKIARLNKTFVDVAFDNETGEVNEAYDGIRAATYDVGFKKWLEYFPREQIHVVNGDRLKTDPFVELQEMESFLGVDHMITRNNLYFNETKGYFCKRRKIEGEIYCMPPYKGRKHPDLEEKIEYKLRQYFAPHDARFEKLAGKEIKWTKGAKFTKNQL